MMNIYKEYIRKIPLEVEENNFNPNQISEGDAIVVFSKEGSSNS